MPPKTKKVPKYKTAIKVVDSGVFQGVCSCGWEGNRLSQQTDLSVALAAVQSEIQAHKHLPKEDK